MVMACWGICRPWEPSIHEILSSLRSVPSKIHTSKMNVVLPRPGGIKNSKACDFLWHFETFQNIIMSHFWILRPKIPDPILKKKIFVTRYVLFWFLSKTWDVTWTSWVWGESGVGRVGFRASGLVHKMPYQRHLNPWKQDRTCQFSTKYENPRSSLTATHTNMNTPKKQFKVQWLCWVFETQEKNKESPLRECLRANRASSKATKLFLRK